jgi:2,4-dichlorophenol 6-monooxygenase
MTDLNVPVLVVGGGGAGLTMSMELSTLGVHHLLVNAWPGTSILPKAHVLNQRTMEILHDLGVAEDIYAVGTPPQSMAYSAWYAGVAGDDADTGRRIAKLESWGAGGRNPDWVAASAKASTNLPQIRLEPHLRRRADELNPGHVRFDHELLELDQDSEGVTATILDKTAQQTFTVRCQYLVAADGGRTVGPRVGVTMEGMRDVVRVVSFHISTDLSAYLRDDDVLIRWVPLPQTGGSATIVPMGPEHWGPRSEEWVVHLNYQHDDTTALDDEKVTADLRRSLGVSADHAIQIHVISRWSVEGVMADRFRVGRVLLAGDAGHRHPPTGGLGLNSAIQDAHNLAWKLALVLSGQAGDGLLDSYEAERRPVTSHNVQRSLDNAMNHLVVLSKVGMSPEQSAEENWAALRRLWSADPADAQLRRDVLESIHEQSMEFNELNVEYGFRYDSQAVVGDGTAVPTNPDPIRIYQADCRPGSPLPHALLCDLDGSSKATMDLVQPGRFLLVAGEDGQDWVDAAAKLAADTGLPLDALRVGHANGDLYDPRSTWTRLRGHGSTGAVLVRPDRFVCWRAEGRAEDAARVLVSVLSQILARA